MPREHIVFIVLENHEYSSVTSTSMPFLTSETAKYVKLIDSFAITHPSLPNYMTLTVGEKVFASDCDVTQPSCRTDATNIVDQLEGAGLSWKAYMETMPSACYNQDSYGAPPSDYRAKHDPFMHYSDVYNSEARCRLVVPLTQLTADLKADALPAYAFISPNQCNDAHSCSLSDADAFLITWVPQIEAHLGTTGVIFVTFDEGTSDVGCCKGVAAGGHIFTAILGRGAKASTTISASVDAYSLLAAVEANWGLALLGNAGKAPLLTGWQS